MSNFHKLVKNDEKGTFITGFFNEKNPVINNTARKLAFHFNLNAI